MKDSSVIIVGAGLAGLSAGVYARANGYAAHIFELHTRPGGVCTAWERGGYTVDGCIHWLMGSRPGHSFRRMYDEVGALEGNRLIFLDRYACFTDEATGAVLDFTADLDRLEADMKAVSPADAKMISRFVGECRALRGFDMGIPGPREMMKGLEGLGTLWRVRRLMWSLARHGRPASGLAARFNHPFLGKAVSSLFLPEIPAPFIFMTLAQLADGQLAAVEGGSLRFAEAIARKFEELGGQIRYGAEVKDILVEGDRAVGIRLTDGSEHRADAVISAADGHGTIFGMLGGRFVNDAIRRRYETWPLFRPIVHVSYGVKARYPSVPHAAGIFLREPVPCGGGEIGAIWIRVINYDATLAPPGGTVVQVLAESDFDFWWELAKDRPRYEEEKKKLAAALLTRLEFHLPGIVNATEMTDVATPRTFWRYTRNRRGAFEGWLPTMATLRANVEKTLPGLRDFYLCGQWVEPGGGVPPAIFSGRNAVRLLCRRDGKPFSSPVTDTYSQEGFTLQKSKRALSKASPGQPGRRRT